MPPHLLAKRAGDERRRDHSAINEQIINLESVRPAVIAGGVEGTDLAGEVAFETANAGEQTNQREQKAEVKGHEKMSGRHEQRSDGDGARSPKDAVGQQTAA